MKYSEKVIEKLNHLLIKNIDIQNAYENAVTNTDSEKLRLFFQRRYDIQTQYVNTLRREIFKHGQIPKNRNRFLSYISSNVLKVKFLILLNNEKKIAASFIQFEEMGLKECEAVLIEKELPNKIKDVLLNNKNNLQQSLKIEKSTFELA
jgi:uncharacterized protein (TIGR02284 family)